VYAIIENGGKQYKVTPGEVVKLEIYQSKRPAKTGSNILSFFFPLVCTHNAIRTKNIPIVKDNYVTIYSIMVEVFLTEIL